MGLFMLTDLTYADDVTLMSLKKDELQTLLNICTDWALNNGMRWGFDKCFAVVFNSLSKNKMTFQS